MRIDGAQSHLLQIVEGVSHRQPTLAVRVVYAHPRARFRCDHLVGDVRVLSYAVPHDAQRDDHLHRRWLQQVHHLRYYSEDRGTCQLLQLSSIQFQSLRLTNDRSVPIAIGKINGRGRRVRVEIISPYEVRSRSRSRLTAASVENIPEREEGEGEGKGETTMVNADRKLSKRDYALTETPRDRDRDTCT